MCDEPEPALAVGSLGPHHCRQAPAVAFWHLLTKHVNQNVSACVRVTWTPALERRETLQLVRRHCVGGGNIFRLQHHANFWLTFPQPYFDIFYPTSNPTAKRYHLEFLSFKHKASCIFSHCTRFKNNTHIHRLHMFFCLWKPNDFNVKRPSKVLLIYSVA